MRSFRKIERSRVETNAFKKYCLRKMHEKRQFLHVLKGLKDIGNENFYFLYPLNLPTEYLIFSFCAFVAFRSCK